MWEILRICKLSQSRGKGSTDAWLFDSTHWCYLVSSCTDLWICVSLQFPMIRLPTLYARSHEFSWYFCDFIWFSTWHWSSRLKPLITFAPLPHHLVSASCLPRTASHQVRVHTASDRWNSHSMEHMRFCNVSRLLPKLHRHCLSTVSSSALHMSCPRSRLSWICRISKWLPSKYPTFSTWHYKAHEFGATISTLALILCLISHGDCVILFAA
jgi:hypothetical protein